MKTLFLIDLTTLLLFLASATAAVEKKSTTRATTFFVGGYVLVNNDVIGYVTRRKRRRRRQVMFGIQRRRLEEEDDDHRLRAGGLQRQQHASGSGVGSGWFLNNAPRTSTTRRYAATAGSRDDNNDDDDDDDGSAGGNSRMDYYRKLLEGSWNEDTMGIIPSTPEDGAYAAADSIRRAMQNNTDDSTYGASTNTAYYVNMLLPEYDITKGDKIYDVVQTAEFCVNIANQLDGQTMIIVRDNQVSKVVDRIFKGRSEKYGGIDSNQEQQKAVVVDDDDAEGAEIQQKQEKETTTTRRRSVAVPPPPLPPSPPPAQPEVFGDMIFYDDFSDFGGTIGGDATTTTSAPSVSSPPQPPASAPSPRRAPIDTTDSSIDDKDEEDGRSKTEAAAESSSSSSSSADGDADGDADDDVDAFRQQLISNWEDSDSNSDSETKDSDSEAEDSSSSEPPTSLSSSLTSRSSPNSNYRFVGMLGNIETIQSISKGVDMEDDVINVIKENSMPQDDDKNIIIMCPSTKEEIIGVRAIVQTYNTEKTIILVNCNFDTTATSQTPQATRARNRIRIPIELITAQTAYSFILLVVKPATPGAVPLPKETKVVVIRRYPDDWQVYIDSGSSGSTGSSGSGSGKENGQGENDGFQLAGTISVQDVDDKKNGPSKDWITKCIKRYFNIQE